MTTIVDEHAVAVRRHIERDILISLLAGGASILVPDIDALPVLDVGAETFAEPEHLLAHAEMQLDGGEDIRFVIGGPIHAHAEFAGRFGDDHGVGTQLEPSEGLAP